MKKITIDSTEFQEFSISFEGEFIRITLSFRQGSWFMDLNYKDKDIKGIRLSSAVLMLTGKNFPFDIVIDDKGSGIDPFAADSFERGFFDFNLLEREEGEDIRGFKVE